MGVKVVKSNIINLVLKRMAEGYKEQLPHYEKMLELAHKQTDILGKEDVDTEELLEVINDRQSLIENLESMNEGIVQLKLEIRSTLDIEQFNISSIKERLSGMGVDALSIALAELASVLAEIKEVDDKNEKRMGFILQDTREKLNGIKNVKKADKAYQTVPVANGGIFVDYTK